MRIPAGFELTETLHAGKVSWIARGRRLADSQPVILKGLRGDFPPARALANIQHEYAILQRSGSSVTRSVAPLSLHGDAAHPVLVFPDHGGKAVSLRVAQGPLTVLEALRIGREAALALAEVHAQGIVHRDIKPANIIMGCGDPDVRLVDFGAASVVDKAQTVEVLACQVWLKPTLKELGFAAPSLVMTGEAPVTDTYADMTEVLQRESWGTTADDPHSLAYFCGALSGPKEPPLNDPSYPKTRLDEGWRQMFSLLRNRTGRLWPKATSASYPNGTDPQHVVAPEHLTGEDRWRKQYVRVNIDPGERFTLTPPGCLSARLWPQLSGFANLALAGDWTRNPINAACVEGAAMSGILAARKITGINYPVAGDSDFPGSGAPGVPATTGTMPAVVEQIGITSGPGPLELTGVKALVAVIPADRAALTKWCNDNFTNPSGGRVQVRPLVDAVLLQWAVIDRIRSLDEDLGPKLGWFAETDVGFWIPLGKGKQVGEEFVVEELVLAPAILFVNQPTGHTSGREVWGFPKQRGLFVNPKAVGDPGPFEARVHTVEKPGGPADFHPLLRVSTTATAQSTPLGDAKQALTGLLQMLVGASNANLLPGLKLPANLAQLIHNGTLPMLFLKQIRDCEDVHRACYQAVTQCGASATYHNGATLGQYQIEIQPYYSHPIAETLGLQPISQSLAAVWLEFDAVFENARVLANAAG